MGLFDSISKSFSDIGGFVQQAVNLTGQFYGFDPSDGWKWNNKGGMLHAVDEGIGEITGRNQSRASLNFAKDQFGYAQAQAQGLIAKQQWQRQQNDIMASGTAAAQTRTAQATGGINFTNAAPTSFGQGYSPAPAGKDLLGL